MEHLLATDNSGTAAAVTWSVPTPATTYGSINSSGQYTPPGYLTADSLPVTVTAALTSNPSQTATATITVTPGFVQPLTPENAALGANGTQTLTGIIAEAGGSKGITYTVASTSSGSTGGQGSLGATNCTRSTTAFTTCSVNYTAPSPISTTTNTYVVATVGSSSSKTSSEILLNSAGVSSNPTTHQARQSTPIILGTSGGNNDDYDTQGNQIIDCCGGTLGSLIQNTSGSQFLLSNNHVLARSDQAQVGETIVQPGLIEDNCTPYGDSGSTLSPVGTLTGFLSLKSSLTNVDAAIAAVDSGAVNTSGSIYELGLPQSNGTGTLAAAPPGTSLNGGTGEPASLNMAVAKSGRTTGLTCAAISTVALDVSVSYYTDCAETTAYLTKTYTNQIGITGNQFSDAGDSGSLVVDISNAEPVGLFFAGGVNSLGVSEGVANPAPEVLSELNSQLGGGPYTFVGTTDHQVSCLNYGNATATAAQARILSSAETTRAQQALEQARMLVSSQSGILGVATGKSSDHAGEGAVILYVDASRNVSVPATVNGVRTIAIPTTAQAVAYGTAPQSILESQANAAMTKAVLSQAIGTKQQVASTLMRENAAFFGVGVGQSLDNPKEAAMVIYVDRRNVPAQLPATIEGLRTRYIIMDRLHVTRSYLAATPTHSHCMAHTAAKKAGFAAIGTRSLNLK